MKGQFLRFVVVGVGATLLHSAVYVALQYLLGASQETPVLLSLAYCIGYGVSFLANYFVSLQWTFKTDGNVGKGLGFAFSHAVNMGMQVGLLHLFLWCGLGAAMAGLMNVLLPWAVELFPFLGAAETLLLLPIFAIVVPMNFIMVRFFLTRGDK